MKSKPCAPVGTLLRVWLLAFDSSRVKGQITQMLACHGRRNATVLAKRPVPMTPLLLQVFIPSR